jgi:hypothetical protein
LLNRLTQPVLAARRDSRGFVAEKRLPLARFNGLVVRDESPH